MCGSAERICVKVGDDDPERYDARTVGDLCIANGLILDRDGTLYSVEDGSKVGRWSGRNPVTIVMDEDVRICTK